MILHRIAHLVHLFAHYPHTVTAAGVTTGVTVEFIDKLREWVHLLIE
jgi:hypothetical protein